MRARAGDVDEGHEEGGGRNVRIGERAGDEAREGGELGWGGRGLAEGVVDGVGDAGHDVVDYGWGEGEIEELH